MGYGQLRDEIQRLAKSLDEAAPQERPAIAKKLSRLQEKLRSVEKSRGEIAKFNPYHDPKNGRFTTKQGAGGGGSSSGGSEAKGSGKGGSPATRAKGRYTGRETTGYRETTDGGWEPKTKKNNERHARETGQGAKEKEAVRAKEKLDRVKDEQTYDSDTAEKVGRAAAAMGEGRRPTKPGPRQDAFDRKHEELFRLQEQYDAKIARTEAGKKAAELGAAYGKKHGDKVQHWLHNFGEGFLQLQTEVGSKALQEAGFSNDSRKLSALDESLRRIFESAATGKKSERLHNVGIPKRERERRQNSPEGRAESKALEERYRRIARGEQP